MIDIAEDKREASTEPEVADVQPERDDGEPAPMSDIDEERNAPN